MYETKLSGKCSGLRRMKISEQYVTGTAVTRTELLSVQRSLRAMI
jgi:hypothetical protein